MPSDPIQTIIANCRNTLTAIKESGGVTQTLIESLTARLDSIEREVQTTGAAATPAQKAQSEIQLTALLDAIRQIASDGPANPSSEMHKDFASNRRIYAIGIFATVLTGLMIVLLLVQANKCGPTEPERNYGLPVEVASALPLIAIMGALGGLLNCIQSFGGYVGNRQFLRSWTLYYFLFPLKGAGLAIIVFFLIHTDLGRQNLDSGGAQQVSPTQTNAVILPATVVANLTTNLSGQVTTNFTTNMPASQINLVSKPIPITRTPDRPNLVMACLVAALTGMFANQAIEMLASVFAILFKKVEGKDGYANKSGGAPAVKPPSK
jgi:hypothetical protein